MIRFIDNTDKFLRNYNVILKDALREIGIIGVAEVQSNCPVDTGTLKRSYTYENKDFNIEIGTTVDYSVFVEFKPKNQGGRPHLRSSLERKESDFLKILKRKLGEINV